MNEHHQQISKAVMDKTTTAASYATSGTFSLGGLVSSDMLMFYVGAFFALLTFTVNWWYQRRKANDEREHREFLAKLAHERAVSDEKYQAARNAREHELHLLHVARLSSSDEASGD